MKNKWRIAAGSILGLLIVAAIFIFAWMYYETNIDSRTSAKPQAEVARQYIEDSGARVVHTYNRSADGGFVRSPSFEYYVEFPNTDINMYAKNFLTYIKSKGYKVQSKEYVYDQQCNYRSDWVADGITSDEHCTARGYTDPNLLGSVVNKGEPYIVVYGTKDTYTFRAQFTGNDFSSTSNDSFFQDEYNYGSRDGANIIQPNHSMLTLVFARQGQSSGSE